MTAIDVALLVGLSNVASVLIGLWLGHRRWKVEQDDKAAEKTKAKAKVYIDERTFAYREAWKGLCEIESEIRQGTLNETKLEELYEKRDRWFDRLDSFSPYMDADDSSNAREWLRLRIETVDTLYSAQMAFDHGTLSKSMFDAEVKSIREQLQACRTACRKPFEEKVRLVSQGES